MVRMIGGKWRGRKLIIPEVAEVRPTLDRVRETVFNWLSPNIIGATCLDAFAGSGVLGFEALSRDAASVTFVDANKKAITQITKTAKMLNTDNADIVHAQFPQQFSSGHKFDVVFLDPPFNKNLIETSTKFLQDNNLLNKNALIYIEAEVALQTINFPKNWQPLKHKTAGEVAYYLYIN